jgi:hypothetical protein
LADAIGKSNSEADKFMRRKTNEMKTVKATVHRHGLIGS